MSNFHAAVGRVPVHGEDAICSSELPVYLFDLAVAEVNNRATADGNMAYIICLLDTLGSCIARLISYSAHHPTNEPLNYIITNRDKLWRALYAKRAYVLAEDWNEPQYIYTDEGPRACVTTQSMAYCICSVTVSLFDLVRLCSHGVTTVRNHWSAVVLLHAFSRTLGTDATDSLPYVASLCTESGTRVIQEAFETAGLLDSFFHTIWSLLKTQIGISLLHLIRIISAVVTCLPTAASEFMVCPIEGDATIIMEYLALACQRQLCHHTVKSTLEQTETIVLSALVPMSVIIATRGASSWRKKSGAIESIRKLELLPLYAFAMANVKNSSEVKLLGRSSRIVLAYLDLLRSSSTTPETYEELIETIGKIWFEPFRKSSLFGVDSEAMRAWMMLGTAAGLQEGMEARRYLPGFSSHYRCCQWRDCLCSHKRPPHTMHVCKGCWRVLYCCKLCQKSDWIDHRRRCKVSG